MALKKSEETEKTAVKKAAVEKKSAVKKAETEKKPAARKTAAAKKTAEEKKVTAPKATKKRAASRKKEPVVNVVIEYAGRQVRTEDVVASITEAYVAKNPDSVIETLEVYIQPEKNVAYYVVNGEPGKNTKVRI